MKCFDDRRRLGERKAVEQDNANVFDCVCIEKFRVLSKQCYLERWRGSTSARLEDSAAFGQLLSHAFFGERPPYRDLDCPNDALA